MSEQKIKLGYIVHNPEDDVHVVNGNDKKTLSGLYDGTPIETSNDINLSAYLTDRKLPLNIIIKKQSKEVTAGTSRTTVTPDEGYVLSEVQVEPIPNTPKTVQAQPGEVLVVEPDAGTLLNKVTVQPVPLQHKEVTPTKSSQTIYPDTGKSFNAISVKPIPDEYIVPTGSKQIAELGKVDVTGYAEAEIVADDLKPEYIKKDKTILGVIGTLSTIGGTSWDDVDLSTYILGDLYIFHAQNGIDMYIGSSASNSGIYHINKQTGVLTQIYTSGYSWKYFFEDSKGNVYVGGGGGLGVLHISGTTVTQIYTLRLYWQHFFEDSKGNVYVSSGQALLHLSGTTATQISTPGSGWRHFFEDSKGNIYVSSNTGNTGLLHLSDVTATQIYSSGSLWQFFFEDSKGNVYVSSSNSASYGILHLSGTTATQIYTSGNYWQHFFEDSKGNVYVSNGSNGILHLSDTSVTQIYSSGNSWQFFFEDSKGNVYVSSSNSASYGILHLSGTTATQIYTSGYYWQHFFEDSKGNIYVGGNSNGIVYLSDATATRIYSSGSYWQFFFEDSKGNVYVSSSYNSISTTYGILHLSGTTATQIYTSGNLWQFKETDHVYAYIDQYPTPDSLCLMLDGTTAYSVPIYEELLISSKPKDMLQIRVNTNNSCNSICYGFEGDNLDFIKNLDVSQCTSAKGMYHSCKYITRAPKLNFTNRLNNTSTMFAYCLALEIAPEMDTSSVTDASSMFSSCNKLTTVPAYDLRNNKKYDAMFSGCSSLKEANIVFTQDTPGDFDYYRKYSFTQIFSGCSSLTRIPEGYPFSTLLTAQAGGAFQNCTSLEETPEVRLAYLSNYGTTSAVTMFSGCTNLKRVLFYNMGYSYNFSASTKFEVSDIIRIMAGCIKHYSGGRVLTLGSTNLAKLEGVYVKPAEITLSNGDVINGCVQCENTDEGAVTPEEYMASLGWTLA